MKGDLLSGLLVGVADGIPKRELKALSITVVLTRSKSRIPKRELKAFLSLSQALLMSLGIPKRELKVHPLESGSFFEPPWNPEKGVERELQFSIFVYRQANPEKGVERITLAVVAPIMIAESRKGS